MIISIENVSYTYERAKTPALSDISLQLERGDIFCALGPNGSGKTTLLNIVLGIFKPGCGTVHINGKCLSELKSREIAQLVSYVPQLHNPTFPYTVREMILMGRNAYVGPFEEPGAEDERICDEIITRLGLSDYAEKSYTELSGGELRLVLLGRALCQNTDIIVLDEPTAFLDYSNEMFFLEMISEYAKKGKTIIMSTHSPNHAFWFESRGNTVKAAFLDKGHLHSFGTPDELITEKNLEQVYGVKSKILEDDGLKTVLLKEKM